MIDFETIITLATTIFIVANPIGNSPVVIALIKDFPMSRQRYIMIREGAIAFFLALFFQYFGEFFLGVLMLQDYAIAICGGIVLFLISLSLIFPKHDEMTNRTEKQEPFIVPIATPLLTGPSLLTIVMLYSKQIPSRATVTISLCAAWIAICAILLLTPYLQKLIGNKGIRTLGQLMGMVLSMISVGMIVKGLSLFIKAI